MKLFIDVGNTRIKWYEQVPGSVLSLDEASNALSHSGRFFQSYQKAFAGLKVEPECVCVANVAGLSARSELESFCRDMWGLEPWFAEVERKALGITNGYHNLDELGVDRWLAVHGARQIGSGHVVVIDCGTAINVEVLTVDNNYLGGAILPGLNLALQALSVNADGISAFGMSGLDELGVGRTTKQCVQSGAVFACVGGVEKLVSNIKKRFINEPMRIIVTGGAAESLLPFVTFDSVNDANLVLRGLIRLAQCD
ncbi:MAG: type III pantothenate kinase [Arenicella sp.]